MTSISTYGTLLGQENINSLLKGQLNVLTQEASTGTYADVAKQLGPGIANLFGLQDTSSASSAIKSAASTVGAQMTAMQTALSSMGDLVGTITTAAVGASTTTGSTDTEYTTMGIQGSGAMDQLMQLLNTTYGGKFVFSGQDSGTQTMASSSSAAGGPNDALSTLLSNAVAANGGAPLSSSTLSGLQSSLSAMFSDSSGSSSTNYTGVFFTATDNGQPVTVSTGGSHTLSYNSKGNSQAFRDLFQGMSELQMLNAPSSQLDDSAKAALLTQATNSLLTGQTELTQQAATLGSQQAQLQSVQDTRQATMAAAQISISSLMTVDAATVATNLSAIKNQLETSYEVTSTLQSLSLVSFLHS